MRLPSPSMAVAVIALVFAAVGSAAATKVLVRSGPRKVERVVVYKKGAKAKRGRRGKRGKRGPAGPKGAAGLNGAPGLTGTPGPAGPGAAKLVYSAPKGDGTARTAGGVDGLTISASCGETAERPELLPRATSDSDGVLDFFLLDVESLPGSVSGESSPLTANVTEKLFKLIPGAGKIRRVGGQLIFHDSSDSRVVTIQLDMLSDDVNGVCRLWGTAVPSG